MEFAREDRHPYVANLERIQCLLQVSRPHKVQTHFGLVVTSASKDKTAKRAAVSTDQILEMNNSSELGFSTSTHRPPS